MTLEYRCSNCGTRLQTTNADAVDAEIERLRAELAAIVEYCDRDGISAVERLRAVRNTAEQATRHLEQKGDGNA